MIHQKQYILEKHQKLVRKDSKILLQDIIGTSAMMKN